MKNKKKKIKNSNLTSPVDVDENTDVTALVELLNATKGEYVYLQTARNSLHTRVGILIALLSALVSAAFIKDTGGLLSLFKSNIVLAHFKVIFLAALFVSFVVALISYVSVFFVRSYKVFPYEVYTSRSPKTMAETNKAKLIIAYYKEYAKCISQNEIIYDSAVKCYMFGNKWLIATILSAVISIIISLF